MYRKTRFIRNTIILLMLVFMSSSLCNFDIYSYDHRCSAGKRKFAGNDNYFSRDMAYAMLGTHEHLIYYGYREALKFWVKDFNKCDLCWAAGAAYTKNFFKSEEFLI